MTRSSMLEVETTFDADDQFTMPDLSAVAGVADVAAPEDLELEAEYHDTDDLRLLRGGITLRRRTGGHDEGWHLKVQRGSGVRIEVHRPLGRSPRRVPPSLAGLVTAHVRDATLAPVARLRTRRRAQRLLGPGGGVLAEVADDRVRAETATGSTSAWREVEVELAGDGDPELLAAVGERLRDAGAAPAAITSKLARALAGVGAQGPDGDADEGDGSAGAVVAAVLAKQTANLLAADVAVRLAADDAVHKMRVAARRLRSALATYRRLLDREVTDPLRDELRWLGGVLGPARDAEVIVAHLRELTGEQPRALVVGPVRRRITSTLDAERRDATRRAVTELSSPRYLRLVDALDRVADAVGGKRSTKPAGKVLAKEVRRAHRRMRRRLDQALATSPPEDHLLHDVRKAAKRVRYAAESVARVYGDPADELAGRMEAGQEVLGAHQDAVVVGKLLRRLAADAEQAGEPSFTYGRLHALEEQRAARARDEFLSLVDDGWADRPSWLG